MKKLLSLLVALHLFSVVLYAQSYDSYYTNLPVDMPTPEVAVIPDNWVNISDFDGVGDGTTLNTEAFRKAISALEKLGGGHLVVPSGVWLSGLISLKSNIDLHLERNAIIVATHDREQLLKDGKPAPLISASKRKNVSISGEGTIDGNGNLWRPVKRSKVSDDEWKQFLYMGGMVVDDGKLWYPFGIKRDNNFASTYSEQERVRTHLIRFTDCDGVYISGVTLQNSPKFHLIPTRCNNVIIDGVTVHCPWNAQNGDAIDLSSCRNALVVNCIIDAGDDGICMKAGAGESGLKYGPCENILIQNNTVYHAHGGFVIGSEYSGGMKRIVVRDNRFSGTDTGLRFKSGVGRGGECEHIYISNIVMTDIKSEAIVFECTYQDKAVGKPIDSEQTLSAEPHFVPHFCDITIDNVVCYNSKVAISAQGIEGLKCIYDVEVKNSTFIYTDQATRLTPDVDIRTENCRFVSALE